MNNDAFIYDAIRTPRGRGKASGALHEVKPVNLVADLLNELADRNNLSTHMVDDIVLGCVTQIGDHGACLAKTAALAAGWHNDVAGFTLNRFCASGAEAVNLAAMKIRSGWEAVVVAGGVESMSRVPMLSDGGPWANDPETSINTQFIPQGVSADLIATLDGFSREQLDEYAARSHHRANQAWDAGKFNESIIPVRDQRGLTILAKDETIRPESSVESLSTLKPAFTKMGEAGFDDLALKEFPHLSGVNHLHTPANSSGIVDGASLLLIANQSMAHVCDIQPRGRIVSTAVVGDNPTLMLTGPAPAARKALALAGLSIDDIDLYEVNEAFASVVLHFQQEMKIPWDKINVNGGAIAMGHPLGATGAMLIGTVLDELEIRDLQYGLVTLCVGGGMGIATIIERV